LRTKLYSTLVAVCVALLALPALATAQSGGPGDNLADAPILGNGPLPLSPAVTGLSFDTTNYTTENGEFNQCGQSLYGKTAWSLFGVNRTGRIDITAAGFDSVLAINSVTNSGNLVGGPCTDRLLGKIESFPRDNLPTVKKGGVYALQVGGFQKPDGSIEGGPVEIAVELLPPERVQGDAILTWRSTRGGIKVTSIKVSGPRGSAALITCLRKSCGKDQTIRNPKLKGVFARPIAKEAPSSAKPARGGKTVPPARNREQVHIATTAFRGRTVKNGSRLLVVVLAPDQIGQAFFWDVKKNAAGTKSLGCVEPDGDTIQKPGTCDGA
jgi:hypothetical protein